MISISFGIVQVIIYMDIKKITVDSSKQLKMGVLLSYISIGVNILTGLIYTPWVISTIGQENFGLYTLAMSVISIFVFDFGLSSAVYQSSLLRENWRRQVNFLV